MTDDIKDFPVPDEGELLRREPRGFSPEQMVKCEACSRANPPTRTSCLYCAAALPRTETSATLRRPTLRRLEQWEQGVNCIISPDKIASLTEDARRQMAQLLRLEPADLARILEANVPLPVAHAASLDEAATIESGLGAPGVPVLIVSDEQLELEADRPKRIRALEMTEDSLTGFPTGGGTELLRARWQDVSLLVLGRLFSRRVEFEETRGRKSENEIIDARELNTDMPVLDIYTGDGQGNWRIVADSFNFSCLGDKKLLLASANFAVLIEMFRARAPRAVYDDTYNSVRHALTPVWPLEQHTESRGWRRAGVGRFSTESATTSDNETQFTRYSRLRKFLQSQHES